VAVANLNTNRMNEGLAVYLDVDATNYNNTVTNLVAGLVTAGYTDSSEEASSDYNLRVIIPKAYLSNGSSDFIWDFTDTSTGTTNATVSGLRFVNWPVCTGTIFIFQ
jgi:hypothetical protein